MELGRTGFLTIHLNDYFQCGASSKTVPQRYWGRFESRLEANTVGLLDELDALSLKASFFSSGWIADRFPDLLAEIADRGHEIASTGYFQKAVRELNAEEFSEEVVQSRIALERASGREIIGYRCAGWLRSSDQWALEVLANEGIKYDSSVVAFGLVGDQHVRETPYELTFGDRTITEVPIPSGKFVGIRFPISGGTYLRQLPKNFIGRYIEDWQKSEAGPWQIYFQISELDSEQPRISALSRFRKVQKYRNIEAMRERVFEYLDNYEFTSIGNGLGFETGKVSSVKADRATVSSDVSEANEAARHPITIVVPCYQEEDAIPYLANALNAFKSKYSSLYDVSCVFVDDGSTDRTPARLEELFGTDAKSKVITHDENRGVTAAVLTGIQNAPTEVVCVIDCDCSYSPETLASLLPELGDDVALVTASPYHSKGSVVNVPGWRLFLSRGLSTIYQQILSTKIATYSACCRVYRKSAMAELEVENSDFLGMTEIIVRLDERGEKIVEVPAVLEARFFGSSKMKTLKTIIAHSQWIIVLLMRRRADRHAHPAK